MTSIILTPTQSISAPEKNNSVQELHETLLSTWMKTQPLWKTISLPHPDIITVSDSSEAPKINQIRAFLQELQYPPHQLQTKLCVIWNLDEASVAAQNALLKSIEEPPESAQIIATVRNFSKILPTIQSRAAKIPIALEQSGEGKEDDAFAQISEELHPDFWKTKSYGALMKKAASFGDREEAKRYIESLIQAILQQDAYPNSELITMVSALQDAHLNLQANANVTLTMESCFFGLKLGKNTVYKQ